MSSDLPKKETNSVVEMAGYQTGLTPIWEYDWRTESVRQMPRTPMAISWYGIVLAMGCYPIVIAVIVVVALIFIHGISFQPEMIVGAIVFVVVGFPVGAILGAIMAVPAYLLLQVVGWVSGGAISSRGASGVFGGLTGFLCSTGSGLFIIYSWGSLTELIVTVVASLLAIVMGYFGAIGVGYRYRSEGYPFFESLFAVNKQFSIWSMLKLTTLVAVLSVICKAAGPVGFSLGIAWAAYTVVQVLLLLGDHWFGCWMGWRKANPQ